MEHPTECTKCQGEVEIGFMVDHTDVGGHQAVWASGVPTQTFSSAAGVAKSERTRAVVTFRCTKCGYLESYATSAAILPT